jgi:CubicO group peptidase (beta-lactamase class C family)
MKRNLFLLLTWFLACTMVAQTDTRLEGVEKDLNEILEATQAAGFAVAVVEKDKLIYSHGFGFRDYENGIPADGNTLFAIGSSTKAFTCAILGQLREEEKLSLDDSPIDYIPELRFYNDNLNANIIIKDLMAHRTGLPRHDYSWYYFPTFERDSLLLRIKHQEPFTGLRQQWYYNNFMFLTQGVIAERITGDSWEQNIRERFFEPLGMTRSNLSIKELENSSNAAFGYGLKQDSVIYKMDYYKIAGMAPAGSINSSVNEMANWMITWLNGGKFKEEKILPEDYVREAMSSHMVVGAGLPSEKNPDIHMFNYGYGWFLSSYKGHYMVQHGGNINGFSANVALYPTDSIGIVVLANQNGSAVPSLARNTLADRLLNEDRTPWGENFRKDREKAREDRAKNEETEQEGGVENTKPSHIKLDYAGSYSNPGYGSFEVVVERDSLFAKFERFDVWLKHYHYDVFQPFELRESKIDTTENSALRFNFETNTVGDISGVSAKLEATIDPIYFKRTPASVEVDPETLKRYVGEFSIGPTTITVFIKKEKTLYLKVPGQPDYELMATGEHEFVFKAIEGFKAHFKEDENGEINSLLMIQPQGNFTAQRKKTEE